MAKDWAAALQECLVERAEKVPAGWKTCRQIATEMGRSMEQARRIIKKMMAHGGAECKKFKIVHNKEGHAISTTHFRLK